MSSVNKMILKKESAKAEAVQMERESAKHPGVGNMPTGKKAAKKSTIGMG